jgi:PAS domain S-box-containing protein
VRVFWKDKNLIYLGCNAAFVRDAGFADPKDIIGKDDYQMGWRDRAEMYRGDDRQVIESGAPKLLIEEPLTTPDGKTITLLTSKIPLRNSQGEVSGVLGAYVDITERKRLEAERDRLADIVQASPDFIGFAEPKTGQIQYINRHGRRMCGIGDKEDLGNLKIGDVHPAWMNKRMAEIVLPVALRDGLWEGEGAFLHRNGREIPVSMVLLARKGANGEVDIFYTVSRDITKGKAAETELAGLHKQLLDTSREAGMAEVATNVLHNVGNVLNSVNVSTGLIVESVKKSRVSSLARVVTLLQEHAHDLGAFVTNDSRGKHVPAHLAQLSEHLRAEQGANVRELDLLRRNVDHIKEIVTMQQSYAALGGMKEMVKVVNLVEDSLRINEGAFSRHELEVIREFENVPPLNVEKHKILQILVNLLRNAKYACQDSERADKRLTVRVANDDGRVKISVEDNGVGIPPENLTRIFNHGFTTRKDGHGFGLHSGAVAAKEMGGSLTVHSDGPGRGATFTLELPSPSVGELT